MSSECVAIQCKFSPVIAMMAFSVASSMLYITIKSVSSFSGCLLLILLANPRKIEFTVGKESRSMSLFSEMNRKFDRH